MVEEYSVARKEIVCFPIIDCYPVPIEFRNRIRASRIERRPLSLGNLLNLTKEFTR